MLTAWETSMPVTPKKARTISTTERIESVANEVLAGHHVQQSLQQALQLAKAVRFLLRENHRLTSNNARLVEILVETKRLRSQAIRQLLRAQLRLHKQAASEQRLRPARNSFFPADPGP